MDRHRAAHLAGRHRDDERVVPRAAVKIDRVRINAAVDLDRPARVGAAGAAVVGMDRDAGTTQQRRAAQAEAVAGVQQHAAEHRLELDARDRIAGFVVADVHRVGTAGTVVRRKRDVTVRPDLGLDLQRAHGGDIHRATDVDADRRTGDTADGHRAGVGNVGAAAGRLALDVADLGEEGLRRGADVVLGKQIGLAREHVAAARAAVEDAAVRSGDEGGVGRAGGNAVDAEVSRNLDDVGAEEAGDGQVARAAASTVDVEVVARDADRADIRGQVDVVVGEDVGARLGGRFAGCGRRVDDRQVRAQVDVAARRRDAVDVHVAVDLAQPDAAGSGRVQRAGDGVVGLQPVGRGANVAAGGQINDIAGELGRIAVEAVEDRAGRRQVHAGVLRLHASDIQRAAARDVDVVERTRGERARGQEQDTEILRRSADAALAGFQNQVAAGDVGTRGRRVDDVVLRLDAYGVDGGDRLDVEAAERTQVDVGARRDIEIAGYVGVDVVALVDTDLQDARELAGRIGDHRGEDRDHRCLGSRQPHVGRQGDRARVDRSHFVEHALGRSIERDAFDVDLAPDREAVGDEAAAVEPGDGV